MMSSRGFHLQAEDAFPTEPFFNSGGGQSLLANTDLFSVLNDEGHGFSLY